MTPPTFDPGAGIQGCLRREPSVISVGKAISEHMSNATVLLTAVERGEELRQLATRKLRYFGGRTNEEVAHIHLQKP